ALITAMDTPLGAAVGNALEVKECIEILKGGSGCNREILSMALAARMVALGGKADSLAEASLRVDEALESGRGLQKLQEIIIRQGGDPRVIDDPERLPRAPQQMLLRAERGGYVDGIDAEKIGRATMLLGAGRDRAEDGVDHAVGIVLQARPDTSVRTGDALAEIHYRSDT